MEKSKKVLLWIFFIFLVSLGAGWFILKITDSNGPKVTISEDGDYIWSQSGKKPNRYTWEEYQALEPEEQEAFYQWFDSKEAFEDWMESVKPQNNEAEAFVWDESKKEPKQYSWEEYQSLTPEEQEAFYQWFDSKEAFEDWMESVEITYTTESDTWNVEGKKPDQYTWEEYQGLAPEEQEAFYQWFESEEAYENWMESAKPQDITSAEYDWDESGKQPEQYTWEEYQALTPEEQEAFYQWFSSIEAFENWMQGVKPQDVSDDYIWDNSGKQPDQYTWEEYQTLNPEEQEAFYQWFTSMEAFETWMESAQEGGE